MEAVLSPNGQSRFDGKETITRLYVATTTGVKILERAAHGAPWKLAASKLQGHHISTMCMLPGQPGIFAGTHGDGVFFSVDGREWEPRSNGLRLQDMYTLAAVKDDGATVIYAGTEPASLFKSRDLGKSWTEYPAISAQKNKAWTFPAPPHVAHTKMLAFDPRNPRHFYAAIEQGALLETTDAGQSWRELADYSRETDRAYKDLHQIVITPSQPDRMFMTAGCGSYRSADGGLHWERMTEEDFRIAYPDCIALSPDEKTLFLTGARVHPGIWRQKHDAGTTIFRSRDAGSHWEQLTKGIPETARCNIEAMSVAGWPGGYGVFLGDTDGSVYLSEDGGDSFSRIAEGIGPVSKGNHWEPLQPQAAE